MPVCPWCKAAVPSLNGACPKCGKPLADVPDLDIPQRVSKGQQPAARPAPAPAPARPAPPPAPIGVMPDHGNIDVEDVLGGPSVSLDLDLSKGPPMPSQGKVPVAAPNAMLRMSPNNPAAAPAAPVPAPEAKPAASMVRSADSSGERPAVDPYEARALSDYGDPPAQWFKTPLYAYRVLRRRPELKRLAGLKRREAERTLGAADDALTAFAELVRPTASSLAAFARPLDDVRMTEQVMRERDAVLGSETDAHKLRQAEIDAKLAELEAQLGQVQTEERNVQGELAESDALLKRAEARVKRIDIEIRNALEHAGMLPPGDSKGPT